jgi:hypothetical protein
MNVKNFKNNNLIFTPCQVDVNFWKSLVNTYLHIVNIEELYVIYQNSPEDFFAIIEPLGRFIAATEEDLNTQGYLEDTIIQDQEE